ncbi:MAG: double zinc ribbon domain-containing protein [Oscillospiraceae bacterium]|nr:double zinc ribbon domain-containing protein [Oscillospiraceae bacterium]
MPLPELLDRLVSLVFPQRCLLCDSLVEHDDFLCEKCALVTVGKISLDTPSRIAGLMAVVEYTDNARGLVLDAKKGDNPRLYTFLAIEIERLIARHWGDAHFDLIAPIPTTQGRRKARGFNQTELIAAPLGKRCGIPVQADLLTRAESSKTQHELSEDARRENAFASYRLSRPELADSKTVLLIDDLITTGYTMSACAACLLTGGATAVYAIAIGYRQRLM